MTSRYGRTALRIGVAALLAGAALGPGTAAAQTWTMKIGADTINDVQHEWIKRYGARVEKASNGRIKAEYYPSGQLGGSTAEIKGMQLGTIEARIGPGAFLGGIDPRFQVLDSPGWFTDLQHARRTVSNPIFRDPFLKVPEAKGLIGVSLVIYGPSSFVSRTPIKTIGDFKGKKIRVMGSPMQTSPIQKLGGTASPMPWGETLPALQNGMIDGVKSALPAFVSVKFFDAGKYLTLTNDSLFVSIGLVSKVWFDKLPSDLQAIIRTEGAAVEAELLDVTVAAYEKAEKDWAENGGEVIRLSDSEQSTLLSTLSAVPPEVLKDQPQVREMYDLLIQASKASI
ncbi:MAG: TRAP transporter substrate-binding protein [Rhodospirillaceae bacterium]